MAFNKTKIDWCDYTWNPITGCLHRCEYCYARGITQRFHNHYPNDFEPTFWSDRINYDKPPKKTSKIFVASMGDLFGDWWWQLHNKYGAKGTMNRNFVIERILSFCEKYPEHTFIFLTKNPKGMQGFKFPQNCWCGVTITKQCDKWRLEQLAKVNCKVKFISAEPLIKGFSLSKEHKIDWCIIGAMTGNNKIKTQKFSINIVRIRVRNHLNIPLFIKDNVYKIYPDLPKYKEYPV